MTSKLIVGSISYCVSDEETRQVRAAAHRKQLEWLGSLHLQDTTYYRVEQAYTDDYRKAIGDIIQVHPIVFDTGIGPAAARNVLLKRLYASTADWLLCLDDDRKLFSHYGASQFIEQLVIGAGTERLARNGVLVNGVCPERRPFKKLNAEFGLVATQWNLRRATLDGCLQVCCIPNLVKYGYEPVYFNEQTDFTKGEPPEDILFEIDWILAKHSVATNMMMVVQDMTPQRKDYSTVYSDFQARREAELKQPGAVTEYIRRKTHNRIQTLRDLNRLRNSFTPTMIPRLHRYQPVQSDFDRYLTL